MPRGVPEPSDVGFPPARAGNRCDEEAAASSEAGVLPKQESRCDGWDLCECASFPVDYPCDGVANVACDTGLAEVACCASP
ncbi:MAG: hypothetical protein L6Q93_10570 [Phycisphaerae bacterium]|nr:hypothetical protein [Phycisphaerae bacterium]